MNKEFVYKAEDVFEDIKGDEDNVLMNIPPEISEKMGWQPGDVLKIEVLEGVGLSISKVESEDNG